MTWYELADVSLSSWLAQVLELFSSVLSSALSVPVFGLFAALLLLMALVGLFAALLRQRGLGR